jgi:DNA-binding MarR family transcriptional regulator
MASQLAPLARPADRPSGANEIPRLVDFVHDTFLAALRRLHPTLAHEGITMGQFWALHTVSSLESASLSTVARYLGVSSPSACQNIDQLEAAGLVRRHRSERDRRAVELSLTPRGRKVESRVWSAIARVMSEAARDLSTEDVAAAIRVFEVVSRRLTDEGTAVPEGP